MERRVVHLDEDVGQDELEPQSNRGSHRMKERNRSSTLIPAIGLQINMEHLGPGGYNLNINLKAFDLHCPNLRLRTKMLRSFELVRGKKIVPEELIHLTGMLFSCIKK